MQRDWKAWLEFALCYLCILVHLTHHNWWSTAILKVIRKSWHSRLFTHFRDAILHYTFSWKPTWVGPLYCSSASWYRIAPRCQKYLPFYSLPLTETESGCFGPSPAVQETPLVKIRYWFFFFDCASWMVIIESTKINLTNIGSDESGREVVVITLSQGLSGGRLDRHRHIHANKLLP